MERGDRAPVATFHAPTLATASEGVSLGESYAHHARVKRLEAGDRVRLSDGAGLCALGTIARIARAALEVRLDAAPREQVPPPPPVTLLVPVADRERMLWLAEKSAELALTRWRPVLYERSRSVSPRGEGEAFRAKVLARMVAALEQSGGAWLPEVEPETTLELALRRTGSDAAVRLLLDPEGAPLRLDSAAATPLAFAFGPEGGLEPHERAAFADAGWLPVSLSPTVLRFETAGIAALAVARSALLSHDPGPR